MRCEAHPPVESNDAAAAPLRSLRDTSCFDAQYTKIDEDGEYAGFWMSGHLLRNESINNATATTLTTPS